MRGAPLFIGRHIRWPTHSRHSRAEARITPAQKSDQYLILFACLFKQIFAKFLLTQARQVIRMTVPSIH